MKYWLWRDRESEVVHAGRVIDGLYEDDAHMATACGIMSVFLHSRFHVTRDPVDCMSCLVKEAS